MASGNGCINIYCNGYKDSMTVKLRDVTYKYYINMDYDSTRDCYYVSLSDTLDVGENKLALYVEFDSSANLSLNSSGEIKWVLDGTITYTDNGETYTFYYNSSVGILNIAPQIVEGSSGGGGSTTEYTIYYYANGGYGAPTSQTKIEGEIIYLSSRIPTRSGYTFLGWGTYASDTSVNYNPGDLYYDDSDLYLYAIWQKNSGGSGGTSGTIYDTFPTTSGKYYLHVNGKRLTATKNGITYYLYIQI